MSGEEILNAAGNNLTEESIPKEKQDLISHFREIVGNLDYEESIKIMEENHWDLEQAIHKIMDIPISQAERAPANNTLLNQQSEFDELRAAGGTFRPTDGVRRRNIGINNTQVEINNYKVIKYTPSLQCPWYWQILSVLWSPFQKLFDMFYYLMSAFQPDARLRIVDPLGDVQTFVTQLEEISASSSLPDFIQRPYGECIAEAKDCLQFLVVYLHDNTNDCTTMVRDVLCAEKFKRLLREENVLLWGCSIQSPEGYRVARLLRQNCYPFIGCIGLQSNNKMSLLARLEGPFPLEEMVVKLRSILHSNEAPMVVARADKEERTRNQQLRQQQDVDYAESLRQDREKDQLLQTVRDNEQRLRLQRQKEEEYVRKIEEEKVRIRGQIAENMPVEADSEAEDSLLVRVKFPSGQVSRRFYVTDSLKLLFYLVKSQCSVPWHFDIISNFPKKTWPVTPSDLEYASSAIERQSRPQFSDPPSFKDFGVTNNITVMVIDLDA